MHNYSGLKTNICMTSKKDKLTECHASLLFFPIFIFIVCTNSNIFFSSFYACSKK